MIQNPAGELSLPISHLQLTPEIAMNGMFTAGGDGVTFNNIFYEGNLIGFEVNKPFSADVCYDMKTI
jgi:hypothetical protein